MKEGEFRDGGERLLRFLASYLEDNEDLPVGARTEPGRIAAALPPAAPEHGEAMESILQDFERILAPGLTHWNHPRFFAYFPANTSFASILGEMLAAGLGVNSMLWETAPAATELEDVVMRWMANLIDLPPGLTGMIQDSASIATLCSLICARERATDFASHEDGLTSIGRPLSVYGSDQTHSSVLKGAMLAGYGRTAYRALPSDDAYALRPDALSRAIEEDLKRGVIPAMVCGTAGTTSTTAIDPLRRIGEICKEYRVWFHVDAALAGTAAILPERRNLLDGVELCDSFTFNPSKWMLTNLPCTAHYVRDVAEWKRAFGVHPEYLETHRRTGRRNSYEWGLRLGRGFPALKLWFVLRSFGAEGLRAMVRTHIDLAQELAGWVRGDPRFELMAPVPLNMVCFRVRGPGDEAANARTLALLHALNEGGATFLSDTVLRGRRAIRFCIGQASTTRAHVERAWEEVVATTDRLLR